MGETLSTKSLSNDLVLEHSLTLFLKVRGYAITKFVRKQITRKQRDKKVEAGKRKSLRKELRDKSNCSNRKGKS